MALTMTRVNVWAATIEDRPGGLAEKLAPLADAGVNLEFVIARRQASKPGAGGVFCPPIQGASQAGAARKAGFKKTASLHSVRVEGPDKRGQGAKITQALAAAGISLRGLSAAAIGRKFVAHLALDTSADAAKAIRALKKLP